MRKRENTEKQLHLYLTPEQKAIIRHCTGKNLDALNLEDCGDQLAITRTSESEGAQEITAAQVLILDLSSEQKRQLRRLTGKSYSQLRVHRRSG